MSDVGHQLRDARSFPVAWISYELDDLALSPEAFRVYLHILRRVGKNDKAWPSYRTIGTHCFPSMKEESARSKAMRAVKELLDWNLIRVEKIQSNAGFHANRYYLTNDSEWRNPSDCISPPSDCISPPSDCISPQYKDLQCKDFSRIDSQGNNSPLTPQGESEEGGIQNEAVLVSSEDLGKEGTEDLTSHQSPEQNHRPEQSLKPGVRPSAAAPDPRFLPTDTMAETMNTHNAIIATGAMRGSHSPDPEFLEYYRVLLSKCTHYRGKDCNSNHAKSSLVQKWKSEPLKILADAESWLKAKAKTTTSTQVRSTKDLSLEEKMAILQRVQDRKNSQAKGA